jgi:uncharacterized RmlC-like cupin family protein
MSSLVNVLPVATEMASVNMRLDAGAVRELHWHKTSEWAYVLKVLGRRYVVRFMTNLWLGTCTNYGCELGRSKLLGRGGRFKQHTFIKTSLTSPSQKPGDLWYFPPGIPHSLQVRSLTGG